MQGSSDWGCGVPLLTCGGSTTLAQAMLAQSQALTSLVAQLASASTDPVLDLGGAGAVGVRGASQRARLQDELAQ